MFYCNNIIFVEKLLGNFIITNFTFLNKYRSYKRKDSWRSYLKCLAKIATIFILCRRQFMKNLFFCLILDLFLSQTFFLSSIRATKEKTEKEKEERMRQKNENYMNSHTNI